MDNRRFITGLGLGVIAGGTLGMIMAPSARKRQGKHMVSRALKGMGDVIDEVTEALNK